MKGDDRMISALNGLLADELTAINQYMVHSEMCGSWGYEKLHEAIEQRAITEMRHGESLIERILFLQGVPVVSELNKIHIGAELPAQYKNDWAAEDVAIKGYTKAIKLAAEVGDYGTRQLLMSILHDEEEHMDWIEMQLEQIEQMGLAIYLAEQLG
jgi:bacterioferritin